MLIIKTFHLFFVVSWFACLFYLPRLFVNNAMQGNASQKDLLNGMQKRLIGMMNFTFWGTLITGGLFLYSASGGFHLVYFKQGWLLLKGALVIGLIAYHFACVRIHRQFAAGLNRRGHVWFRYFNEIPAVILLAVLYLVINKPF